MRKLFIGVAIALLLFSCDDGGMEDKGPFSLIGTWEAEGEYVVEGVQWTEKSSLIFSETEFRQEILFKSRTREATQIHAGKYTYDDNYIMYIDTYDYNEDGSKGYGPYAPPEKFRYPYKFINKNTLETNGFAETSLTKLTDKVYKRKN